MAANGVGDVLISFGQGLLARGQMEEEEKRKRAQAQADAEAAYRKAAMLEQLKADRQATDISSKEAIAKANREAADARAKASAEARIEAARISANRPSQPRNVQLADLVDPADGKVKKFVINADGTRGNPVGEVSPKEDPNSRLIAQQRIKLQDQLRSIDAMTDGEIATKLGFKPFQLSSPDTVKAISEYRNGKKSSIKSALEALPATGSNPGPAAKPAKEGKGLLGILADSVGMAAKYGGSEEAAKAGMYEGQVPANVAADTVSSLTGEPVQVQDPKSGLMATSTRGVKPNQEFVTALSEAKKRFPNESESDLIDWLATQGIKP